MCFSNETGKVCLSILGTWSGPSWTSVQTLGSILLNLQSLMNNKPLLAEPGHENDCKSNIVKYNLLIEYETIRYSIIHNFNKTPQTSYFYSIMNNHLNKHKERIEKRILSISPGKLKSPPPFNRFVIDRKNEKVMKDFKNLCIN